MCKWCHCTGSSIFEGPKIFYYVYITYMNIINIVYITITQIIGPKMFLVVLICGALISLQGVGLLLLLFHFIFCNNKNFKKKKGKHVIFW